MLQKNLLMVQRFGLYGVILSTIISTLAVGMPWLLHNLFSTLFPRKIAPSYCFMLLRFVLISAVSCALCWLVCRQIGGSPLKTFLLRLPVCLVIPNGLWLLCCARSEQFVRCRQLFARMVKRK